MPDVIPYWKEILSMCKSENDYLFSKGLVPGTNPIEPYQNYQTLVQANKTIR
ncbi:hypothetical protein [Elizabethkingia anophelis]|uniref:hypothetical protein n=1 Tax=Elizabethkingia anophelis TaxID=1117645 RepID=UPI0024E0BE74|nr:hypothetical protein [Elizabethkingia anophelis]HDP3253713.1 hypothetical protein [Elizabethkingia anophelis]